MTNWNNVLPDVGMLYRNRIRNRAEIDAIRHLTWRGKFSFISLGGYEGSTPSHETPCIARVDIERLLACLTAKQREAVILAGMDGLGKTKLSRELGINVQTAEARRQAGMRKLRRLVQ